MADSPLGPFHKEGEILATDNVIANAPGHNGYLHLPEKDDYYMVYRRRPMNETGRDARVLCIDRMYFQGDCIKPWR